MASLSQGAVVVEKKINCCSPNLGLTYAYLFFFALFAEHCRPGDGGEDQICLSRCALKELLVGLCLEQ